MTPSTPLKPASALRTVLLFRCPNCGRGAAMRTMFATHERCAECGFAFKRGNPAYFSGAIFINYLLGAGSMLATFLVFLVVTWPGVPWTALRYLVPIAAIASVILLNPVSKAILMAVDIRMRPVTQEELRTGSHGDDLWQAK
jgi:uncharacterized protein (DUF983 family)